jgi:hypothetical protein
MSSLSAEKRIRHAGIAPPGNNCRYPAMKDGALLPDFRNFTRLMVKGTSFKMGTIAM